MGYRIAVVGATGAVGQQMVQILAHRRFPASELRPLASVRSAGKLIRFAGRDLEVRPLDQGSFDDIDLALFSAGGAVSRRFGPIAARAGALVIDNTSAFRLEPDVPLVVPEVNGEAALEAPRGIIANPNCSTIQMVVALEPLRRAAGIRRIVVSTYQAVSGAGARAIEELRQQTRAVLDARPLPAAVVLPQVIAFECLPQIGDFRPDGYSTEERKMIDETRKIFGLPKLRVTATTVRVPVLTAHCESINVETERPLAVEQARELLRRAPGVELIDEPEAGRYPLARQAAGRDPVYVGRIRQDPSVEHGLDLWVVADNLRKGAALNAIQIAELLHQRGRLRRPGVPPRGK